MLRAFLIYLSNISWAQHFIMSWGLAWRMASRFIAGGTQEDAIRAMRKLNEEGLNCSVDYLGENVESFDEAENAVREALSMLEKIQKSGARSNISVKLSQMGLNIDSALCRSNMARILRAAQRFDNFIRIDMEGSSLTQLTLETYIWLREQGYDNVGIVIQSYLYRSAQDLIHLNELEARVRLCKGAYKEPAEIAFPQKAQVDENFDQLTLSLFHSASQHCLPRLSDNGRTPPIAAIATHDTQRIEYALNQAQKLGLPPGSFEFQMLYGIRRDLQLHLARQGHPVRIYVPYGTQWYPYFMRRLAERPANLWFFLTSFLKK